MLVVTASPARTALKNSQLTCGERHAYFGDRTQDALARRRAEPCSERREVHSLLFEQRLEAMPFDCFPPSRNFLDRFVVRKIKYAKKTLPLERTFKGEDRLGRSQQLDRTTNQRRVCPSPSNESAKHSQN